MNVRRMNSGPQNSALTQGSRQSGGVWEGQEDFMVDPPAISIGRAGLGPDEVGESIEARYEIVSTYIASEALKIWLSAEL